MCSQYAQKFCMWPATPERDLYILIQLQIKAPAVKLRVFHPSWGDRFTVGNAISHIHDRGSPKLAESVGHCTFYCKTHIKAKMLVLPFIKLSV